MVTTRSLFVAVLSCLLFLSVAHAGDAIVIYGNERKPPKNWVEDKKARGIIVDMMRWISKESGQEFNFDFYPWKRAYKLASAGKGGIIGFSKTPQRMAHFDFSDVMYYDDMMLVVTKGSEFAYEKLEDLSGKRIAVLRGASFGEDYARGLQDGIFTPVEVNNPRQGFHLLRDKRVDVVLVGPGKVGVDMHFMMDSVLKKNRDKYTILPKPFVRDPNYLGFAKSMNKGAYLKTFNTYVKKGWESGAFDKIITSYEAP